MLAKITCAELPRPTNRKLELDNVPRGTNLLCQAEESLKMTISQADYAF